jgi:hypothetical protein
VESFDRKEVLIAANPSPVSDPREFEKHKFFQPPLIFIEPIDRSVRF